MEKLLRLTETLFSQVLSVDEQITKIVTEAKNIRLHVKASEANALHKHAKKLKDQIMKFGSSL